MPSAAVALALSLLGAHRVEAQPSVALTWDAPAPCPQSEAVLASLANLVGEQSAGQNAPDHSAEAQTIATGRVQVREGGHFRLTLRIERDGEVSERMVDATTCPELASAAALMISLAIAPMAPQPSPSTAAEPALGSRGSPGENAPPPAGAEPPPAHGSPPLQLVPSVGVGGWAASGDGPPGPAFGLAAEAGAWLGPAGAFLRGALFPSTRQRFTSPSQVGADFQLAELALAACARLDASEVVAVSGCLTAAYGRLSATPFGATDGTDQTAPWTALGADTSIGYRLSSLLRAELRLALVAPTTRPFFTIEGDTPGTLHRPAALGLRLGLGLVLSP